MYALGRAHLAAQLLVSAVYDVMSPNRHCSASKDVRIVPLRPQVSSPVRWHTATEAFPGVAVVKVRSICLDEDQLLAVIYASRIWISWCANELGIDNDMPPVGREVSRLELLLLQVACNAACSTRIDVE